MKKILFTFLLALIANVSHASEIKNYFLTDTTANISVGPNPASTYIQIYTIGIDLSNSIIQITDLKGKVLVFEPFASGQIDLKRFKPKLSTGYYFITIRTGVAWKKIEKTIKILIEK